MNFSFNKKFKLNEKIIALVFLLFVIASTIGLTYIMYSMKKDSERCIQNPFGFAYSKFKEITGDANLFCSCNVNKNNMASSFLIDKNGLSRVP